MRCRLLLRIILCLLPALVFAGAAEPPAVYRADFDDGDLHDWRFASGPWEARDGALTQPSSHWARHIAWTRVRLEEGTLRVRARVNQPSRPSGASFGVVLRYPGEPTFTAVRAGTYGNVNVEQPAPGGGGTLGGFSPEIGRFYELSVALSGKVATVSIDDAVFSPVELNRAEGPGYVGLYTECDATFDDFEVHGTWRHDPLPGETGTPVLVPEFAEWSPLVFDPQMPFGINGTAFLYYRNEGDGEASVDHILVDSLRVNPGRPGDWVGYVRQRPSSIPPGGVGQLEVKLNGMPRSLGMKLVEHPLEPLLIPVTVVPRRGKPIVLPYDFMRRRMPVQVNFMGFSEDLKTVYVYLQNNEAIACADAAPFSIAKVEINGTDVTARAMMGSHEAKADVVPIVIPLGSPLVEGAHVRVVLTDAGGARTGHSLRAFPSKFNILVATNFKQPRLDFMEDLHHHGVTALIREHGSEAFARLGFDFIPMGGVAGGFFQRALRYKDLPVVGVWMDEVDKPDGQPVTKLTLPMEAAERDLPEYTGKNLPLHCFNLVSPRTGGALMGHIAAADAIMHSYGYHMCRLDGLGRLSDLAGREYRLARRPFWPYFRDGEIVIPIDPEAKKMLPRDERYMRTLTPNEARWIQFSTLCQGAKSFAHWGYWAFGELNGFYFLEGPTLRMGLGALAGNRAGPYEVEPEVAAMLHDVWDEIGRINAELRTIGPIVARSDVSYLGRVSRVEPATDRHGNPAAEAVALVAGTDTIILLVVNHNIDQGDAPFDRTRYLSNPDPPVFDPVEAVAEVRVPAWLEPKHVFTVDYQSIETVTPEEDGDTLRFRIPRLEVSRIYVITSSDRVKAGCLARHETMQGLLAKMAASEPVPNPDWSEK